MDFIFAIRNTKIAFRCTQDKKDATRLVLKTTHGDVGGLITMAMGIEALETKKGGTFYLTFVDKKAFLENFSALAIEAEAGNLHVGPVLDDVATGFATPVLGGVNELTTFDEDDALEPDADSDTFEG